MNEICDMSDVVGEDADGLDIPHLRATDAPTSDRMQFHVQMDGYTQGAMESLIVEAAARIIIGRSKDTAITKQIEIRCAELLTKKIDERLEKITAEIISQPVMSERHGKATPITMGEMVGLVGRDYLSEMVDNSGKAKTPDSWGFRPFGTRAQWLAFQALKNKFKFETESATAGAVSEIQAEIRAAHNAFLDAEKARFRQALAMTAS